MILSSPAHSFASHCSYREEELYPSSAEQYHSSTKFAPFSSPPTPSMMAPTQPGPSYHAGSQQSTPRQSYHAQHHAALQQSTPSQSTYGYYNTGPPQSRFKATTTLKVPLSPTKQKLKPVDVIIRRNRKNLNQAGIGRLAISLARESVFGPDIMAENKITEDGLIFIEQTLHNLLKDTVCDDDFNEHYWKPARKAIMRACGHASKGKETA